ncbi:MAG: hypothetical protein LUD15_02555, partial [Bacteroides sp.]|nr:hypothetical protein [Bacteroides sp.]
FTSCNNDELSGVEIPGSTEKGYLSVKLADGIGSLRSVGDSEVLEGERELMQWNSTFLSPTVAVILNTVTCI